jgi:hypothetical protein
MAVIVAAGAAGATFEELGQATGLKLATLRQGWHYLADMGASKARTTGYVLRLFGPGVELPEKPAPVARPQRPPKVEAKPRAPRVRKVVAKKVPAKSSKVWNSHGLKTGKKAPQIVMPADVDYSRAKVTQCPSCHDMRHTVHKPEPFFSALAIGNYLPADTWTARVYGGVR